MQSIRCMLVTLRNNASSYKVVITHNQPCKQREFEINRGWKIRRYDPRHQERAGCFSLTILAVQ